MLGSYTYRPDGLRHSKTANGLTLTHLWDGDQMAAELNGTAVYSRYVRGLELIKSTKFGFYLYNGRSDVVQLTSGSGTKTRDYLYDAFGNQSAAASDDVNPFRYCGEYFDKETETVYLRARYYRASTGRFTSRDSHWDTQNSIYGDKPFEMNGIKVPSLEALKQSGNLYLYCMNNPINFRDATGSFVISTSLLVAAGLAIVFGTIGGFVGASVAEANNVEENDKWKYVAGGVAIGGIVGTAAGYFVGPTIASISGVSAISVSTSGVSSIAAAGTSFAKMGTLLAQRPDITVDWTKYAEHGFRRMAERGVTKDMVDLWVETGKALQQSADKYVFITKQGLAVISTSGKLVTTYTSKEYDSVVQDIVEAIYGK